MSHRVAVLGASGRMGQAVIAALAGSSNLSLGAALVRPGHPFLTEPPPSLVSLPVSSDLEKCLASCDVVIDFSLPSALHHHLPALLEARLPYVTGVTGLGEDAQEALLGLSQSCPVVMAPNMSVGVTLLLALTRLAAQTLGPAWDREIFELHHRAKRDAPSGTALALGEALLSGAGARLADRGIVRGPETPGARRDGEIGLAAARGGDVKGEHTVFFLGDGERIELTHRATDRAIFARGALRAAQWALAAVPGHYGMADVLGL